MQLGPIFSWELSYQISFHQLKDYHSMSHEFMINRKCAAVTHFLNVCSRLPYFWQTFKYLLRNTILIGVPCKYILRYVLFKLGNLACKSETFISFSILKLDFVLCWIILMIIQITLLHCTARTSPFRFQICISLPTILNKLFTSLYNQLA